MRVLVVDDTVVFRRAISDALSGLPGVEVIGTAANGKLALARMSALRPDLVTLDIEMPEMNGIEVLEAMGPAGLKAGVIVLSSVTTRGGEMTVRALELGAFDFITKPYRGTSGENLAYLRESLQPMIRAFERRRDIRAMLGQGKGVPQPADVPAAVPRLLRPACRLSGARLREHPSGSDRRLDRRSRRFGCPVAGAPGGSECAGSHRSAHAADVHQAAGGQPCP
jgi:two-component system, chemotaxis family, protein-glutamate methylesterase/glutaminase